MHKALFSCRGDYLVTGHLLCDMKVKAIVLEGMEISLLYSVTNFFLLEYKLNFQFTIYSMIFRNYSLNFYSSKLLQTVEGSNMTKCPYQMENLSQTSVRFECTVLDAKQLND